MLVYHKTRMSVHLKLPLNAYPVSDSLVVPRYAYFGRISFLYPRSKFKWNVTIGYFAFAPRRATKCASFCDNHCTPREI